MSKLARRGGSALGLVAILAATGGAMAGAAVTTLTLSGGESQHVTCSGSSLQVANQTTNGLDLTCVAATPTPTTAPVSGDAVTEHRASGNLGTSTVSASVTSTSPELVVAWVSADDAGRGQSATVSGGGLNWTLAGRANTQRGDAEAWYATTTGASFTATATAAQSGKYIQLTAVTYSGAKGIGTVLGAGAPNGAAAVSLTPQATGSLVGAVGMDYDHAAARTVLAGSAVDRQDLVSSDDTLWSQHTTTPTTAGVALKVGTSAPTTDQWNLLAVEVRPAATVSTATPTPTAAPSASPTSGPTATPVPTATPLPTATPVPTPTPAPGSGPSISGSSPAATTVLNNVPSVTTASFNAAAGTVLYAAFSMDSLPASSAYTTSVANSGQKLTWHLLGRENSTDGTSVGGYVEVWWAANPVAQTGINVTAVFSQPTKNVTPPVGMVSIYVVDHAAADQSTAAMKTYANVKSNDSVPGGAITTTAANSLVLGVYDNWDSNASPTVAAGQVLQSVVLNAADQDAYWVQRTSAVVPAAHTTVTISAALPHAVHWHLIVWEILAG